MKRDYLIPDIFQSLVDDLHQNFPVKLGALKYYLDRHIEIDGDVHGELALQKTENLCGNDKVKLIEALVASKQCLQKRWSGVEGRLEGIGLDEYGRE